jgi:hypothetical protein
MADPVKILVKRSEDTATVVERLIDVEGDAVIFSIPPGALFGQALANFKLLKREASLLNREVIIETSDIEIRERAAKAGLGIIETAVLQDDESSLESAGEKVRKVRTKSVKVKVVSEGKTKSSASRVAKKVKEAVEEEEIEQPAVRPSFAKVMESRPRKGEPTKPSTSSHRRLFTWIGVGAGLALIVLGYVAFAVLPTANILVVTQKKSWEFDGVLSIDKSVAQVDLAGSKVPGQLFVIRDSVIKRVPATGKQYVSKKATANLTVFNAYSSQPQNIVANTRFVTQDGVIFRSTSALTIPGAKIENGKIIPSSIDIVVVADKPGVSGNVGPTAKLTIPGFKNTPKYEGFYGTLKEGASGGFVGETSVPTEKDVAVAKEQGAKTVSEQLQNKITASVPPEFTVLAGATKFVVLKQTVQSQASSDGTVGVVTEGQLSILAFREQDVKNLLSLKLRKDVSSEFKFDNDELAYGTLNQKAVVVGSGHMLVPMTYTVNLSYDIKVEDVQNKVIGKPLKDINLLLLELNGISGGKASLSPFYVRNVPNNIEKIKVTIE